MSEASRKSEVPSPIRFSPGQTPEQKLLLVNQTQAKLNELRIRASHSAEQYQRQTEEAQAKAMQEFGISDPAALREKADAVEAEAHAAIDARMQELNTIINELNAIDMAYQQGQL